MILAVVAFMAPSAAQVAADVQAHYAKLPQLTMDFEEKVTDATFGTTKVSSGTMFLAKPNRFRANYVKTVAKAKKRDKDFIFDGTLFWMVDHRNLSVDQLSAPGGALPAASAFLLGGNLANDYNLALTGSRLVLTPKQPSASVKQLELVVDPKTWSVTESIVTAPSGNVEDFRFTTTSTALIPTGTFTFVAKSYPTYKVVVHAAPVASAPAKPAAPTRLAPPAKPVPPASATPSTTPTTPTTAPTLTPTTDPTTTPTTAPTTTPTTAPTTTPTAAPTTTPTTTTP